MQVMKQCPIRKLPRSDEIKQYHRQMLLALEDIPWDGREGAFAGGGE